MVSPFCFLDPVSQCQHTYDDNFRPLHKFNVYFHHSKTKKKKKQVTGVGNIKKKKKKITPTQLSSRRKW